MSMMESCSRGLSNDTRPSYQSRANYSERSCTFNDSLFTFESEENGGAIYVSRGGSLYVNRCTFKGCYSSNRGGAVYCDSFSVSIINASDFTECNAYWADGALSLWYGNRIVTKDCVFVNLSAGKHFGAMNSEKSPIDNLLSNCTFSCCRCNSSDAGALGIPYPLAEFYIVDTLFEHLISIKTAGAISLFGSVENSSMNWKFLLFRNNTSPNGNDVHSVPAMGDKVNKSQFVSCFSSSQQPRFIHCPKSGSCSSANNEADWLPDPSPVEINVKGAGKDLTSCGGEGSECKTVDHALTRSISVLNQQILLHSEGFTVGHIEVDMQYIVVKAKFPSQEQGSRPTITTNTSAEVFCNVVEGLLSAEGVDIIHSSGKWPSTSLFRVAGDGKLVLAGMTISSVIGDVSSFACTPIEILSSGASMELERVCFSKIKTEKPVLSFVHDAQLHFAEVSFSGVKRTAGNGGVLEVKVQAGETVELMNMSFSSCSCSNGNGGGMYVEADSGAKVAIGNGSSPTGGVAFGACLANKFGGGIYLRLGDGNADARLNGMTFTGCSASAGRDVFVNAYNMKKAVENGLISFGIEMSDVHCVEGYERSTTNERFVIPVVVYLWENRSTRAYVSNGNERGADFTGCGFAEYPCRSVEGAVQMRFGESDRRLRLCEGFAFDHELALDARSFDIDADAKGSVKVHVESVDAAGGAGLVMCSVGVVFTNLTFELGGRVGAKKAFLHCASGSLRVKDCSMSTALDTTRVHYSLISVSSGILTIVGFVVSRENNVVFEGAAVVEVSGSGSCTVSEMQLNGTTTSSTAGLVHISSSGAAAVKYSDFSDVVFSSGGIVCSTCIKSVEVSNSSFDNITRSSGDGSCICFGEANSSCEGSGEAEILNCTMKNCHVSGEPACGGAVAVNIGGESAVNVRDCGMEECSAPFGVGSNGKGGAMFLALRSSTSFITLGDVLAFTSNSAKFGNNVFVEAPKLDLAVTTSSFQFFDKNQPFSREAACGADSRWENVVIPLVFYLMEREQDVSVAGGGEDVSVCGFAEYPCKTISFGLTLQPAEKSILLPAEFDLCEYLHLRDSFGCQIGSESQSSDSSSLSTMRMLGDGSAVEAYVGIEQDVRICNVRFAVDCCMRPPEKGLFVVSSDGGMCRMSGCGVCMSTSASSGAEAEVRSEFCVVEKGKLELVEFLAESLKAEHFGLICVCGTGVCVVNGCVVNNCEWTSERSAFEYSSSGSMSMGGVVVENVGCSSCSVIEDANGSSLVVENSTFWKVTRGMGNESVILCDAEDASSVVEISNITVSEAAAVDGCGGALSIIVGDCAHVKIGGGTETKSAFCLCRAGIGSQRESKEGAEYRAVRIVNGNGNGNGNGLGGAVHMKCMGSAENVAFTEMLFGAGVQANRAEWLGKNMFVEGDDLSKIVKTETFGFEVDVESNSTFEKLNGFEGGNESYGIPLAVFLMDFDGLARVAGTDAGTGAADYRMCGVAQYPCVSVLFAASARFGEETASIVLTSSFEFQERIVFGGGQDVVIVASTDGSGGTINVSPDGSGEGESVVESKHNTTFREMEFVLPASFVEVSRCCFMLCSSGTLAVDECSASRARDGRISYSFLKATSGTASLSTFSIQDVGMGAVPVVEGRGVNARIVLDNVTLSGVSSECTIGLVVLSGGCSGDVQNSSVGAATTGNHCVIAISEASSARVENSNFTELVRRAGDGGVAAGDVSGGSTLEMKGCRLSGVACLEAGGKGGSMKMRAAADGVVVCENNSVEHSTLVGEASCGGGFFLQFDSSGASYSMRNVHFSGNEAGLGSDVFVVCPTPRITIDRNRWAGSAVEGQENKTMWVMDNEEPPLVNATLLKYLFPTKDNIIFVNTEHGYNESCGEEDYPCNELGVGYGCLGTEKDVLQIMHGTELVMEIERNEAPLTIRGGDGAGATSALNVSSTGHIALAADMPEIVLTIERIVFRLPPPPSAHREFLLVRYGKAYFVSCTFGQAEGQELESAECGMWIALCIGGELELNHVEVKQMDYGEGRGILSVEGSGEVAVVDTNVSFVSGAGSGLVSVVGTAHLLIENSTMEDCSTIDGGVVHMEGECRLDVTNECAFCRCTCSIGNGGWLSAGLSQEGCVHIEDAKIKGCEAHSGNETNGGKGGGIMFAFEDDFAGDYLLKSISFAENVAELGRDLFVECKSLNKTVAPARLEGVCGDKADGSADMWGWDRTILDGNEVSLNMFLIQLVSTRICISSRTGLDILGCGDDAFPCCSFWRAVSNTDPASSERELAIEGRASIEDEYNLSNFDICSKNESEWAEIAVQSSIPAGHMSAVIVNENALKLCRISFVIPCRFEAPRNALIGSSGEHSQLHVLNCSFACEASEAVEFSTVHADGGVVQVEGFSMRTVSFMNVPFHLNGALTFSNCTFAGLSTPGSSKGGALRLGLGMSFSLKMDNTTIQGCSCSATEGNGGGLFLDCADSSNECLFTFIEMIMSENNAKQGKNMYICGADLNKSVTRDAFSFDFRSAMEDENMFIGRDSLLGQVDLLIFLVGYEGMEVAVSEAGVDVARCGSTTLPCCTFWKAMQQFSPSSVNITHMLFIEESALLRNSFDVSDFSIASESGSTGERQVSRIACEGEGDGSDSALLLNRRTLNMSNVCISIRGVFGNREGAVVASESGDLMFLGCIFETRVGVDEANDAGFVAVKSGGVTMKDHEMRNVHSSRAVVAVHGGCMCDVDGLIAEHVELEDVCLFSFSSSLDGQHQSHMQSQEMSARYGNVVICTTVRVKNSSFITVTREGNGSAVVECTGTGSGVHGDAECTRLQVNGTRFEGCRVGAGEKGVAMLFLLQEGGSMSMRDSSIIQCGCSMERGRGGGVYVESWVNGALEMLFSRMTLKANTAKVGNDIFIRCESIETQINETLFQIDVNGGGFNVVNAIFGIDLVHRDPVDLMNFISIFQSSTILVSSAAGSNGSNERQCGTFDLPCLSVEYGLAHVSGRYARMLLVHTASGLCGEADFDSVQVGAAEGTICSVDVASGMNCTRSSVGITAGKVGFTGVQFVFPAVFASEHFVFLEAQNGSLSIASCSFAAHSVGQSSTNAAAADESFGIIPFTLICAETASIVVSFLKIMSLELGSPSLLIKVGSISATFHFLHLSNVRLENSAVSITQQNSGVEGNLENQGFELASSVFENVTCPSAEGGIIASKTCEMPLRLCNCSVSKCTLQSKKGSVTLLDACRNVTMDVCAFSGTDIDSTANGNAEFRDIQEWICRWNGSAVMLVNSTVTLKDTRISDMKMGGLSVEGGKARLEKGEFVNNSAGIRNYESARRNVLCFGSASLEIESLKGGDGLKENTSMWISSDNGCKLGGLAAERASPFFIPVLRNVEAVKDGKKVNVVFEGQLLMPCNLGMLLTFTRGDEKEIMRGEFGENNFVSENEVHSSIELSGAGWEEEQTEVSVSILFGKADSPSSTTEFILKNRSELKANGDERIVEGGKEGKSSWAVIIAVIFVVLFVIVLLVAVSFIARWKKAKNENKDLREIVNDNIRKDPKAFEMVTMEMSPEEQWRRAEREAEKKNEERAKKRIYEMNMEHSESSEHLLSESGSTEYILGKDSDKIPEWALEKVEEEEETRKRTSSPSVSSTSTTDTSDTDTTFVRGEDLCPTTSSMSNLVDAMACSVPHEKLIVDLRDSLFMLLHGRNEKKEMAIGTLEEREQTAAQILFWVANLALHSFDEMENPLSSLTNLSPLIVLFSEHMVICVAMHSDFSSDSDSSSISSASTIITSSSDCSVVNNYNRNSPPSSAFEDEEDNRKECMRWKAPELLMNNNKGATKKTAVFSIGMMLWECLTLKVPFGEFEAEMAGWMIKERRLPNMGVVENSQLRDSVCSMLQFEAENRPRLRDLKREFIRYCPASMTTFTVSDAIGLEDSGRCGSGNENVSGSEIAEKK
ncbi:uncharacterized protein MONOS_17512 [Monocercomonoides exilis]|uniref:uncharacterized protein n=1 Tax=Monocercomonoides exilis TaxID=2049356 RepID=UPI00355AA6AC|nr:hypothetical protein MONOS_17512 [Monocercomonoides exilis]